MIEESRHLQVTANNVAHIFKCVERKPHLIGAQANVQSFKDPENYVESGMAISSSNKENDIDSILQPNLSGTTIVERRLNDNLPTQKDDKLTTD